jgi:hypothetical protein
VLARLHRLAHLLDHHPHPTMNHPAFSPFAEAPPPSPFPTIHQLAMSEPAPSDIAQHVWDAHNAAKAKMNRGGSAVVQVSVNTLNGAIELIPQDHSVLDKLLALGAEVTITINW